LQKDHGPRKSVELPVPRKRKRGRPTQRWKVSVTKETELNEAERGRRGDRPEQVATPRVCGRPVGGNGDRRRSHLQRVTGRKWNRT